MILLITSVLHRSFDRFLNKMSKNAARSMVWVFRFSAAHSCVM